MTGVFISYRREDSSGYAGRLYDAIAGEFGDSHVFMDVDTIGPGTGVRERIREAIQTAEATLVIIGPHWADATTADGKRRLDDPEDWVRVEVSSAITREGMLVIPVFVQGARMPSAEELPGELGPLADRNGLGLRHEHWASDVGGLLRALRPVVHGGTDDVVTKPARVRRRSVQIAAGLAVIGAGSLAAVLLTSGKTTERRARTAVRTGQLVGSPIPVAPEPRAIATGAGAVWVTSSPRSGRGAVTRIDPRRHVRDGVTRVGRQPAGIAVGNGQVWVANYRDNTISRLDARTGRASGNPIPVGNQPADIAVGFGSVWCANYGSNTVSRIDPKTGRRTESIRVGAGPVDIAVGEGSVWTANVEDSTVSRINPVGKTVRRIIATANPESIAVGPGAVWVGNIDDDLVTKIDPGANQVVGVPTTVGHRPDDVAVWHGALYVANQRSGTVMRIDPATRRVVGRPLPVGSQPDALAPARDRLWIANLRAENVVAIRP